MRMTLLNMVISSVSFWFVRWMRYMLTQRVCRRDPLPRRLDRICGRGPRLAMGQESTPLERRVADFGKESVRPKGGGCFERGTLNADRKANRKGAALFQRPFLMARVAKASSEYLKCHSDAGRKNDKGTNQRGYRSAHLLALSIVLRM